MGRGVPLLASLGLTLHMQLPLARGSTGILATAIIDSVQPMEEWGRQE